MKCLLSKLFDIDCNQSKVSPSVEQHITHDIERLESDLARIQMWVGNCDQKASFLLAIIGIMLALFFSTDVVVNSISNIKVSIVEACSNNQCCQFIAWTIFALFVLIAFVLSFAAIFYLLLALRSSIDADKYKDAKTNRPSFTFFGVIAKQSYLDFKGSSRPSDSEIIDELHSQIYINSKICNQKFEYFNTGNLLFRIALVMIAIIIPILIITYNVNNG